MRRIDIALASFNGARFLPALLASIAGQTLVPDSILVRDDGSMDETYSILERERNEGMPIEFLKDDAGSLGAAANFGRILSHSAGDYTLLADQDDLWHDNKIEELVACAKSMEERRGSTLPLLVYSDARLIDSDGCLLAPSASRWQGFDLQSGRDFKRVLVQNTVPGCTMLANRALLKAALPIPNEAVMHDWWLLLVASALGEVLCIPKQLVDYRQHTMNTLGADAWNIRGVVKKFGHGPFALRRRIRAGWNEALLQMEVLNRRLADQIPTEKRNILESILNLSRQGGFQKRLSAIQLGLRKEGVLRTLAWYWAL
ncbi:hypothetical protein BJI67_11300 [Acidihalobacter aeolianus]|uniref:Glycosyltransferase 2-like domain-containing protein n=1 Tax=Acidihalobacter aeolianus TaxID=2792603 RepID=A0A1D8K9B8_9GAMM|nr:glycosyltransferase family 2 protein [Acidihalobacter aeolianus]AOV17568.1 hypothetical protein BJI67_11300 [Acidihalobacter aeolianus]